MVKYENLYIDAIDNYKKANYDKSIELAKKFLDYNSKNHQAYYLLGLSFLMLDKYNESIKFLSKAISYDNKNADYVINLSKVYLKIGDTNKSINILSEKLDIIDNKLKIYRELANLMYSQNMLEEALDIFLKIIALSQNEHQAYNNCGLIYIKLREFNNAYKYIDKAISLKPDKAQYYFNMGLAIVKESDDFFTDKYVPKSYNHYQELSSGFLNRIDHAISYLLKATRLEPSIPEYHNYLGNAYLLKEFTEKDCNYALICFKNAVALSSNVAEYHSNLAYAYNELGFYQEAKKTYDRLESLEQSVISINYSYFKMKETDCFDGVRHLENRRIYFHETQQSLSFYFKNKYGKDILSNDYDFNGKVVFIFKEEAIGDEIQFIRFVKLIKDRGAYTKVFCSKLLSTIFENSSFCDEVTSDINNVGDFDYFIPLLSIPSIINEHSYRMKNETLFPYLNSSLDKVSKWSNILKKTNRKKIAFTWRSKFPSITFYKRSSEFNFFYDLAKKFPDIDFYSIQKGFFEEEFHNKENLHNIFDLSQQIEDFSDSAGILENVDLLLSIDSAIVHLAGAMNKPVTMLVPYSSDWRWGISGSSTFWYPSMEIIRQTEIGNWQTAFDQVVQKFKKFT